MISKIKGLLLTIFLLTALLSYGQRSEDSTGVYTDIDCYNRVQYLAKKDMLQQKLIQKMAQDTVDWKAKFERQVKTTDLITFENADLQRQVKNIIDNCQDSLDRKTFWGSVFKYTALIAVPVAVVSTTLLIIK